MRQRKRDCAFDGTIPCFFLVTLTGLEHKAESPTKQAISDSRAANSDAKTAISAPIDPDVLWSDKDGPVRAAVQRTFCRSGALLVGRVRP